MTETERKIVIETAKKIKNNEYITPSPVNIIKGKSIKDLFEAGLIYRTILSA